MTQLGHRPCNISISIVQGMGLCAFTAVPNARRQYFYSREGGTYFLQLSACSPKSCRCGFFANIPALSALQECGWRLPRTLPAGHGHLHW